ncbi:NosD domain-containing protein [Patiriisocius marinus]|uniref:Periplasmic copper-binding protein NosD beta helix domain-containing protein n=1 Tax=Patiriisocius marinus TaxID=1397112 RepID=A0A5J4J1V7_9FLAO|nr:NosD domain-containing protein [Patiriisocius marinus]GER59823.1 hypothetical protein ULMA_19310 [Patiriisocius marinus]
MRLFIFLVTAFFFFNNTSAQTEVVLEKGSNKSIQDAVDQIQKKGNRYGTIVLRDNILVREKLNIPVTIDLVFENWSKLVIDHSTEVIIKGKITSNGKHIFITEKNHNLKIHNQDIVPEWFGICSYQNNSEIDDDPFLSRAIRACVEGGTVLLRGIEYRISNTVLVDTKTIHIKGNNVNYFPAEGPSNNLTVVNPNLDVLFEIKQPGVVISYLNFTGYNGKKEYLTKGGKSKATALNFIRSIPTNPNYPDPVKDVDALVTNCGFLNFKNCIYGEGTNLKIIDNHFVASYIGVNLQEAKYINAKGDTLTNPNFRGHVIDRNRFHSMGGFFQDEFLNDAACIKIIAAKGHFFPDPYHKNPESYFVSGFYNQITNNYSDDSKTFFEGSVDRTKIDNNVILSSTDTAIKAYGGIYGTISNNLIDGSFTWNPNKLYPRCEEGNPSNPKNCDETSSFPQGHGIRVRYADHISITNNQVINKRQHGIYIERSRNSTIHSNTIMNFNRQAYIRPAVNGKYQTISTGDLKNFDGIHIECTSTRDGTAGYNIENSVQGNVISMPLSPINTDAPVGRYGIYVGDGDSSNFIKNNAITSVRMVQGIKIKTQGMPCER